MAKAWGALLVVAALLFPFRVWATTQTIVFGGDVMLSRFVREQVSLRGKGEPAWLLKNIAPVFREADLAFVNLESPFLAGPASANDMVFRANPAHVSALTSAGIDVVSFANNHARNQGSQGVRHTLELLGKNAIAAAGAGLTSKNAYTPRYLKAGEQLVAVLAYAYNERPPKKESVQPTIAGMDVPMMQAAVRKAKTAGALVVVSMHAGTEYTGKPTARQKEFAHAAVDAGADIVVGHHPHWVQPVEQYKQGIIAYSLGNLVFDQGWSVETQQGAVAQVQVVDGRVTSLALRPVKIDYYAQPRWMTSKESEGVLARIGLPTGRLTRK